MLTEDQKSKIIDWTNMELESYDVIFETAVSKGLRVEEAKAFANNLLQASMTSDLLSTVIKSVTTKPTSGD